MKNKYLKYMSEVRLVMAFLAVMLFLLTGFHLSGASAENQFSPPVKLSDAADSTNETNALGRLAFQQTSSSTTGSGRTSLLSANADGTGVLTLAAAGTPPLFCAEPSWSPNGAKITYVTDGDIYVMNADGSSKINLTSNTIAERNPSWSATGKIAYERGGQIWTMNANGSNQAQFSSITQPSPAAPAWSPDGSKIAFTSGGEIWVVNADGSNERRVTTNTTADADPAWSPDGAKIIFGKGTTGIAVVNLDGTNEANLTNGAQDGKPVWSNDGTRIAFVRTGVAESGIYTMDAAGANQIRIIADVPNQPGRSTNDNPAWQPVAVPVNTSAINGRITRVGASLSGVTVTLSGSVSATTTTDSNGSYQFNNLPNGGNYTITPTLASNIFTPPNQSFNNLNANQIADFTAAATCSTPNCSTNGRIAFVRGSNIYTASVDGSNAVALTNTQRDNEPMWSPDGSKIVFQSSRDILTAPEIYVINADGTNLIRLTNNTVQDLYPSFSPDGTKILFVSDRDGNSEIYVMNADGTNQLRLTNNTTADDTPTYSPDGGKIVFTRTAANAGSLFKMNADGSNAVQITNAPQGLSDRSPSFSPDGAKIVFERYNSGPFTSELYTVNADGTNQTLLLPAGFNRKPSYSPDGTKIIYARLTSPTLGFEVRTVSSSGVDQLLFANGDRPDWQPIRPAVRPAQFDFDGDGRADVSVFRPANGVWYLNQSQNGFSATAFGLSTDKLAPADYDGDGKTDIAVFREDAFAYFYILNSSNNTFSFAQFGTTGDAPVPGDWDGDGRADLAVYRGGGTVGSPSNFYYRPSSTPNVDYRTIVNNTGGRPLVADFDGDGKIDPALFLPSAVWSILRSSDNQITQVSFGAPTDIPVPADFDGDGKANIAVFRPSNGTWYTSQNPAANYGAIVFGANGDLPVAADYDGDGKADAAVYRNGTWYLNRTTAGFTGVAFGQASDKPIPNAFVQ